MSRTPPHLTLPDLHDDLLARILALLAQDSRRGTPYYPPKPCPHLLSLSHVSPRFRPLLSPFFSDDSVWLTALRNHDTPPFHLLHHILSSYRVARSTLTHLRLHTLAARFPHLRLRVLHSLLPHPPPLRHLDIIGLLTATATLSPSFSSSSCVQSDSSSGSDSEPDPHPDPHPDPLSHPFQSFTSPPPPPAPPLISATSSLLSAVCHTLTSISLDTHPTLLPLLLNLSLPVLSHLHLHISHHLPQHPQSLTHIFTRFSTTLRSLQIVCNISVPSPLPNTLLAATLPHLQHLHIQNPPFHPAVPLIPVPLLPSLPDVIPNLRSLTLHNLHFHPHTSSPPLWPRPSATSFSFISCKFPAFPLHLPVHVGSSIHRLELSDALSVSQLYLLASKLPNVRVLALLLERSAANQLTHLMKQCQHLQSFSLSFFPQRPPDPLRHYVAANVVSAIADVPHASFRKLVLHGETLSVSQTKHVVTSLASRLEYLVTGLFTPHVSRSKAILRLLPHIRRHCPQIRVLCFGLALSYDRHAIRLYGPFLREIHRTEMACPHLDSVWLQRNAANLFNMPKPHDFMDYDSEDDMEWQLFVEHNDVNIDPLAVVDTVQVPPAPF